MSANLLDGDPQMPFRPSITKFALGDHGATLLRIAPNDAWMGLVLFDDFGKAEWINAAYLGALGWRPL